MARRATRRKKQNTNKDGDDSKYEVDSFDDMNLEDNLLRGIYAYGFEKPSAIQRYGIMPIINGRDTIGQAQSGTGKTATFGIGSIARIDAKEKQCQVLVLAPTRELAKQIHRVLSSLCTYLEYTTRCCVGGTAVRDDITGLSNGCQIVVGTPGRINDMISRGALRVKALKILIIDEADEMLSRGFKEQINDCFDNLPNKKQVGLFSTTFPKDVLELTKKYMHDPVNILVKTEELTLDGIKQYYVSVEKEDYKLATLCDIYESIEILQAYIYCNTRRKVMWLTDKMKENDFTVSAMHGDMHQKERELIMKQFRSGSIRVLITTDLLARGIDVCCTNFVINYDLPMILETYIHRIGRAGRFGRKGIAINFVADDDEPKMRDIETFYDTKMDELPEDIDTIFNF